MADCTTIVDGKSKEEALDEWEKDGAPIVVAMASQITNQVEKFNAKIDELKALDPNNGGSGGSAVQTDAIAAAGIDGSAFLDEGGDLEATIGMWNVGGAGNLGSFSPSGNINKAAFANLLALKTVLNSDDDTNPLTEEQKTKINEALALLGENAQLLAFYGPTHKEAFMEKWQAYSDILECFAMQDAGHVDAAGNAATPGLFQRAINATGLGAQGNLDNLNAGIVQLAATTDSIVPDLDFKEQCFLLTHIFNLAKIKERLDHGISEITTTVADRIRSMKALPNVGKQRNRTVLVTGEPFGFINIMTQSPSKNSFFEMTNAQISSLQPMIRFYKVINNADDGKTICKSEKEVEIVFDTFDRPNDIERMFKTNGPRGIGVGVKSFTFAYEGDNPFAIKKSIGAKLSITANTFSELLVERNNSTEPYSYIDLALKTGGSETVKLSGAQSQVATDNLNKLNFRLKAVVGWHIPIADRGLFGEELLDAIYNSAITLNLTPTVHDFNIDDNGKVNFTINYLAYSEDYFDNANFNIFTEPESFKNQLLRDLKVKKLNLDVKNAGDGTDAQEAAKKEYDRFKNDTQIIDNIKKDKQDSLRYLITSLLNTGKVYYIGLEESDAALYGLASPYGLASAAYTEPEEIEAKMKLLGGDTETIDEYLDTAVEAIADGKADPPAEEDIEIEIPVGSNIPFFYAADLIDIILHEIHQSLKIIESVSYDDHKDDITQCHLDEEKEKYIRLMENFHKLRILLGPIEISKNNSFTTTSINLGDIPVSVKNFLEFLTSKMLAKEKSQYFLTAFLNDFFNEFIISFLNRDVCFAGKASQKVFLMQAAITEYRESENDEDTITKYCNDPEIGINPEFQVKCPGLPDETCTKRLYLGIKPPVLGNVPKPVLNVMGIRDDPRVNPGLCKEMNYLCFFAGRSIPMNQMVGCKHPVEGEDGKTGCFNDKGIKVSGKGDHDRGIWHYQIGKSRGIVKTINLTKTDSTGLAEVRFEQEGYDGLKQLRVLYDVTIKSYLDVSAFPGSYIYVEPRGFDVSAQTADGFDLTQLGIGGYHMIWKSEHTIQPGLAESTIHAKWVAGRAPSKEADVDPNQSTTPSKCGAT